MEDSRTGPRLSVLLLTIGVLALIAGGLVVAWQSASGPPRSSFAEGGPALVQVTAAAVPTETVKLNLPKTGVTVSIPASAVAAQGKWSLSSLQPQTFAAPNDSWQRLQVINLQFFDPTGAVVPQPNIAVPLELCFSLDADEWAALHQRPYQIQHYEAPESHVRWVSLPFREDAGQQSLCAQVQNASLFALAVPVVSASGTIIPAPPYSQ
jgi:hypothetical protein